LITGRRVATAFDLQTPDRDGMSDRLTLALVTSTSGTNISWMNLPDTLIHLEDFMNTRSVLLSAVLCLSPLSAFAGVSGTPNNLITLAQADVRIGPNGVTIGDRDRDRDRDRYHRRDRDTVGYGERGDHDRGRNCRTVTVEERGETRTSRRCD
jgi:surface antigen